MGRRVSLPSCFPVTNLCKLCTVLSLIDKWTRLKHEPPPFNVTLDAAILSAMLNLTFTVTALVKYFLIKNECLCFDTDSVF